MGYGLPAEAAAQAGKWVRKLEVGNGGAGEEEDCQGKKAETSSCFKDLNPQSSRHTIRGQGLNRNSPCWTNFATILFWTLLSFKLV